MITRTISYVSLRPSFAPGLALTNEYQDFDDNESGSDDYEAEKPKKVSGRGGNVLSASGRGVVGGRRLGSEGRRVEDGSTSGQQGMAALVLGPIPIQSRLGMTPVREHRADHVHSAPRPPQSPRQLPRPPPNRRQQQSPNQQRQQQ